MVIEVFLKAGFLRSLMKTEKPLLRFKLSRISFMMAYIAFVVFNVNYFFYHFILETNIDPGFLFQLILVMRHCI